MTGLEIQCEEGFLDNDQSLVRDCSEMVFDNIIQLDGNVSLVEEEPPSQSIPAIVNIFQYQSSTCSPPSWYDPPQKRYKNRKPVRVTLRRDNKLLQSEFLPKMAVSIFIR